MCAGTLRAYLHTRDALPDNPPDRDGPRLPPRAEYRGGRRQSGGRAHVQPGHPPPRPRAPPRDRPQLHERGQGGPPGDESGPGAGDERPRRRPARSRDVPRPPGGSAATTLQRRHLQRRRPPNPVVLERGGPTRIPLPALHPHHRQALNITCTSSDDQIVFGLTGCRRTVPDLHPMLDQLDAELDLLETAVGL